MKSRKYIAILCWLLAFAGIVYGCLCLKDAIAISQKKAVILNQGISIARHSSDNTWNTDILEVQRALAEQGENIDLQRWRKAGSSAAENSSDIVFWYDEIIEGEVLIINEDKSVRWRKLSASPWLLNTRPSH